MPKTKYRYITEEVHSFKAVFYLDSWSMEKRGTESRTVGGVNEEFFMFAEWRISVRPVTSQTETDADRMKIVLLGILVTGGMLVAGNNYNGTKGKVLVVFIIILGFN